MESAPPHAPRKPVPFLDEPWYCCAEPMDQQFVSIGEVNETRKPTRVRSVCVASRFAFDCICNAELRGKNSHFKHLSASKPALRTPDSMKPSTDSCQQAWLPDAQLRGSRAGAGRRSRVCAATAATSSKTHGRTARLPLQLRSAGGGRAAHRAAIAGAPVDGLIALGDRATTTAAYAARALGIPYNSPEAVENCRSKLRQREILREAGLPVPGFFSFRLDKKLDQNSCRASNFPASSSRCAWRRARA